MREPKRQNVKRETPLSPDIIVRRCQEAVSDSLPALINHWVAATSLPRSTLQFQANVTQAIVLSVALLSDAPKRKRFSILRSEMSRVEKAASNAAKALRTLQSALDETYSAISRRPLFLAEIHEIRNTSQNGSRPRCSVKLRKHVCAGI